MLNELINANMENKLQDLCTSLHKIPDFKDLLKEESEYYYELEELSKEYGFYDLLNNFISASISTGAYKEEYFYTQGINDGIKLMRNIKEL